MGLDVLMIAVCVCSDMLKEVGNNPNSTTIFMDHGPSAVTDLKQQLNRGIMTTQEITRA